MHWAVGSGKRLQITFMFLFFLVFMSSAEYHGSLSLRSTISDAIPEADKFKAYSCLIGRELAFSAHDMKLRSFSSVSVSRKASS